MILVQKWSFFQFFFKAIQVRKKSFTSFQNEKTPFQAIKTKSSKNRKIDIFPKGLTHGCGAKIFHFSNFFFQARKMCFTIFQNEKTVFWAIKTRTSQCQIIDILPKGLTHGFSPKLAIFPSFFCLQYTPGKCLLRYSKTKKRLSQLKNQEVQKIENQTFFQRVNPLFWSKDGHFSNLVFFRQYRPGKCLLRYSRTKKRLFRI